MKNSWKIGIIIGLVAMLAAGSLGISYAAPAYTSLTTFSWVESNDNGTTLNKSVYNPIDPGDNGNDPQSAQTAGITCSRIGSDVAGLTAAYSTDTITFNIINAYPGYHPTVFFGLKNQWTTPGKVTSITFTNPNPAFIIPTLNGISVDQLINAGAELTGTLDIALGSLPQSTGTASYSLSLTIITNQYVAQGSEFRINNNSLPGGQQYLNYSQTLTASYGNPPYTWSILSGGLPQGIGLNPVSGVISGSTGVPGTYYFNVQVTDVTGDTATKQFSIYIPAPPAPPRNNGGTGGNNGIPTGSTAEEDPPSGNVSEVTEGIFVNIDGTVTEISDGQGTASSQTGDVTIQIANGTLALNADGSPVTDIYINKITEIHAAPLNTSIIQTYDCGPEGATFDPPLTFTAYYGELPAGVDEYDLYIALWNGTEWIPLACTVDPLNRSVTAQISHFSQYALIMPLPTPPQVVTSTCNWWWIIVIAAVIASLWYWFFWRRRRKSEK